MYRGVEQEIMSHRDFNSLISHICDEVYYNTPIMNNELFNKHKLGSPIATARAKYLKALVGNSDEIDLGFALINSSREDYLLLLIAEYRLAC